MKNNHCLKRKTFHPFKLQQSHKPKCQSKPPTGPCRLRFHDRTLLLLLRRIDILPQGESRSCRIGSYRAATDRYVRDNENDAPARALRSLSLSRMPFAYCVFRMSHALRSMYTTHPRYTLYDRTIIYAAGRLVRYLLVLIFE